VRPVGTLSGIAHDDTLYDRIGGLAFFVALVERFYEAVEADPTLRPLYPPDLEPGKANLAVNRPA
jgi:truncated hemoglobin YjbI